MAQIARVTTWATGQVLTASALNGEFNNIVTAWNNIDSASSAWTKLSVSGTSTLAGAVSITPTSGNPLVVNSTDFVVDSTDHYVGIGKAPAHLVDALLTQNTSTSFYCTNASTGTGAVAEFVAQNSANLFAMQLYGTANTSTLYGITLGNYGLLFTSGGAAGMIINTNAGSMYLGTVSTKAMQIDTSQNVIIPNTKLQCGGSQVFPVLQIVQGTSTTQFDTTSNAFVDTNLSVTITPKFNTSKILLYAVGRGQVAAVANLTASYTLSNGSTNLLAANGQVAISATTNTVTQVEPVSLMYYDSPATTSATTYKVRIKNSDNTNTVSFGGTSYTQVMIAAEIAQ